MYARRVLLLSLSVIAFGAAADAQMVRVAASLPGDVRGWDARIDSMVAQGTLKVLKVREDTLLPGRQHVRYEQRHLGVPVWGGDLVRQVAGADTVSVFGTLYEGVTLGTTPTVTRDQATRTIEQLTGQTLGPSRQPQLGILPRDDGTYVLGWRARVFTPGDVELIVLDARSGALVLRRSDLHTQTGAAVGRGRGVLNDEKKMSVRQLTARFNADDVLRPPAITTYDMHGSLGRVLGFLNGQILLDESDEATDPDNNWTDGPVVDAHTYAGYTYDYYFRRFNRRGLDGNDLPLQSLVHPVNREDIFGYPSSIVGLFYVNAFYAGGGVMVYGEGLPTGLTVGGATYTFFSGGLDVVTHELTHGVTEYTSNLTYQRESGALNESFSDMMGTSAEFFFQTPGDGPGRADYLMGEDISSIPIRSMSNPALLGDPDHYSRRFLGPEDNGGVHINSGIPNQVYFLAIEGGTNRTSGLGVQGVGASNRDQIEKVMYRAFTLMMPQQADFAAARGITIQAARDLYGASSAPERALIQAWTAVGVQ